MKSQRQAKIIEIVTGRDVQTQEQRLENLIAEGFPCTQATISRDIKELRIVKELTKYGTYRYTTPVKETSGTFSARLNAIFRESVTSYDYAQNIVVIHTIPGLASGVANAIDGMKLRFVLGTVGGDDTVIVIMRDNNSAAMMCSEISTQLS